MQVIQYAPTTSQYLGHPPPTMNWTLHSHKAPQIMFFL